GYEQTRNKNAFALLYFNPRLQQLYRDRAKWILDTKSPHTGVTLAQDPAVGIVEIVNEDSLFFWTFTKQNVAPPQWRLLEALYGKWLTKRHGSVGKAMAAWGKPEVGDDAGAGVAAVYEAWHMTREGSRQGGDAKRRRVGDQVRFLAELQRDFYSSTARYFKDDLGVGGLVSASNWHVSDPSMLDALERWTYTATDVIDRHGYFSGRHEGEGSGYSVRVGHVYEDLAGVLVPEKLPITTVQVEGFPQIISEMGWTNPNRFKADSMFVTAAYSALQGTDAPMVFMVMNNYVTQREINKFAAGYPTIAGCFPAAALQYRRGDVAEASPAVYQVLKPADLFAMKGSGAIAEAALDELRKKDLPPGAAVAGPVDQIDPLACYVGRVVRNFGGETEKSFQCDFSKYIDRGKKTVTSLTGELQWDYGNGVVRMNTPRSQGVAGFLGKAGAIELGDVTIESGNEYAAVWVTALDDQPLATSKKVLIQAVTEDRPYGFKSEGGKVTSVGQWPYQVREIGVAVTLRGGGVSRVTALDENGYGRSIPVVVEAAPGGGAVIRLTRDSLYHVAGRQ
ncbi:MAG: hypothetical protein ACREIT_11740, partial [Tepidisphaeraceae bacterium]